MSAQQIIHALAERYPNCFTAEQWEEHWPLQLGVREALQDDGVALSERELCYALKHYTTRIMYLRAMVAGATRVNLQGRPKGVVTKEQAVLAARNLENQLRARDAKAEEVAAARRSPTTALESNATPAANSEAPETVPRTSLSDLKKAAEARKAARVLP
jgi:ProP effector